MLGMRPPPSQCLHCVPMVISDCSFQVPQVPYGVARSCSDKDDDNNDYHLNYKATVYLVPSVLHILILTDKVLPLSTLQMKKSRG